MATDLNIDEQIKELETQMSSSDFWTDKNKAQSVLKELAEYFEWFSNLM